VLQNKPGIPRGKFKTPYVNAKYLMTIGLIVGLALSYIYNKDGVEAFVYNTKEINSPTNIVTSLTKEQTTEVYNSLLARDVATGNQDLESILSRYESDPAQYERLVSELPIDDSLKYESGFSLFKHKIPMWIFLISLVLLSVWAYRQNLSLIPLLGLICCLYMMAQLSVWNWIYFTAWLLIGLVIYFSFSRKNSKLNIKSII